MSRPDQKFNPESFVMILKEHGLRLTPERMALAQCLPSLPPVFRTEDLRKAIDASGFRVSTATIYNTLKLLLDCGMLVRAHSERTSACYALAADNVTDASPRQVILVCSRCGRQRVTAASPEIRRLFALKSFGKFAAQHIDITVHGLCLACQRKSRRPADTVTPCKKQKSYKTNKINKQ